MRKFLLFALAGMIAGASALIAQNTPDLNPGHGPTAEIDNKRPLIQKKAKAPTSRTLTGIVTDDSGKPIKGALVTLTNLSTKEHTEFFTKADGRYRFEDLSFAKDYQVQASYQGRQSVAKKMSQYDHTPNVMRVLDIPDAASAASESSAPANAQAKK
jgi:hypothetical protein